MLSRGTTRFFAFWDSVELSTVTERSWSGQAFSRRKSSSVLWRLSLRWWADILTEISARHSEMCVAAWEAEGVQYFNVMHIAMLRETM